VQQAHTASRVPAGPRDKRAQERAESDKHYTSGDQLGARPVARAAGRAEHQPVRMTSALKKGPRVTSAEPAETSRQSDTSGASCRTSQEPAVPRDKRAQKRTSHQERRPRGKRARREPNIGRRLVQAARRTSRTAESGRPPYAEVAFSGIKGGGAFWILQSRRSEHPHGGNCTERHRARTHCGTGRLEPTDHRDRTRNQGHASPEGRLLASAAVRRHCGETKACSR
jgi:hypothetical protein